MENKRELFQLLTRRFGLLNKNCCSIGSVEVSAVQSHILYEIDKQNAPSMQKVAEILAMDITTFSRQIQNLMKMELVTKTASSQDKRISILGLTVQGKFVATTIEHSVNTYLEEVFIQMNEFERDTVIRSLELLNKAMSKVNIDNSTVC
ncbi:MarR family winged helix-turn-helix transcriptional regulator [Psychrobacillus sp. BM2]|uniref:MarR family winged helix-turn-helix transcriptional regulator n=1 Tax=Psychrobacillus sp. BM2 TaxID=3400421 RepID=UPI003B028643